MVPMVPGLGPTQRKLKEGTGDAVLAPAQGTSAETWLTLRKCDWEALLSREGGRTGRVCCFLVGGVNLCTMIASKYGELVPKLPASPPPFLSIDGKGSTKRVS